MRLQKKYIAQAKKTVSSKQWKKRGLKTAWRLQKRAKGTRKGQPRKTARRAYSKRSHSTHNTHKKGSKKMAKMTLPHPSVTGLAAGSLIAMSLDAGYPTATAGWGHHSGDSVISNIKNGDLTRAVKRLGHNASHLVTGSGGRKVLGQAVIVAAGGALVRKWAGNPKLGGTKLYFRI